MIAVLLTALVAFGPLSTDIYLPSLPTLVRVFDSDIATVQLTLSVYLVGFAVSQLVYGPLSDRFGRRPILLVGIAIFAVASAACAMAGTIEQLIVARFFQALGSCCGPVLGRAVVRDVHGRERAAQVLAYMAMAMALAPAIGPAIGGYLTVLFGWRVTFLFLTCFGVVILAAVWLMLAETNRQRDALALMPRRLVSNYASLLRSRAFTGYTLCLAAIYSAMFAFLSGSAFVLIDQFGLTPERYGMAFGVIVVGYMIGTFAAGKLTRKLGIDRLIGVGSTLAGLCGVAGLALAIARVDHTAAILAPMFGLMIGAGLLMPNAQAGGLGPFATMAGAASAMMGFIQMGFAAAAGILVGHLQGGTQIPMMAVVCAGALAAAASHRLLIARRTTPTA
ncbi:MFS transporter permease [Skermanella stibiiresistens SB22]|uniref:Bcr/CflA family efflux transporter n=1 Tax=Skermanella stibiiresistens SB22 TaxID=1385369 RepID=W9GU40_9PROT|nr:MFS transporter permease [Skermanella stibiiresistens SB22]